MVLSVKHESRKGFDPRRVKAPELMLRLESQEQITVRHSKGFLGFSLTSMMMYYLYTNLWPGA